MAAKYIVFKCGGEETPVVFPESIQHKEMVLKTEWEECCPVSAAYFSVIGGKVEVFGFSKSLDLKPRPEDANLIQKLLTSL